MTRIPAPTTDQKVTRETKVQELSSRQRMSSRSVSLGQPVRFSERDQLEAILQRARASDYGVRSLVHEIIQSDLFQTK